MDTQLFLDLYERHYRRGIQQYREGNGLAARKSLLKAAELLFKLAACSTGQLRTARKEKAKEVLALADRAKGAKPAKGRTVSAKIITDDSISTEELAKQWIVTDVPDVRWSDVVGLEDVKSVIRRSVVYPFQYPEVTKKYKMRAGGGVLLYGPPGTGKTMIAKAVANEVTATFFSVSCSDIMSKWVGEAERHIKELFKTARACERAVIFMDETEAIVAKRGGNSTVMNRVIPEFLGQVDGMHSQTSSILILGATNRPWDMDEASLRPGRFGTKIYVPLPDFKARRHLIATGFEGIPLAEEVDIDTIASATEGYSGADIAIQLVEEAKAEPYYREITTGIPQRLEVADITSAMNEIKPSVKASDLAKFMKFQSKGG